MRSRPTFSTRIDQRSTSPRSKSRSWWKKTHSGAFSAKVGVLPATKRRRLAGRGISWSKAVDPSRNSDRLFAAALSRDRGGDRWLLRDEHWRYFHVGKSFNKRSLRRMKRCTWLYSELTGFDGDETSVVWRGHLWLSSESRWRRSSPLENENTVKKIKQLFPWWINLLLFI